MDTNLLFLTYVLLTICILIVVFILVRKHNTKKYSDILDNLEREKNLILDANILSELNKVESMINSDDIEDKYNEWRRRFEEIRDNDIPKLTDALIEIQNIFDSRKYKGVEEILANTELQIYQTKVKANNLLEEIKDLTLSEERNREIVTKLKARYRVSLTEYHKNEDAYTLIRKPVELQFETIDKLFGAFEIAMEQNSFSDIAKIIKALDDAISNIEVVIEESPEIILLGTRLIPKKMNDINSTYNKLLKDGFNLDYLKIDYNIKEAEKKIADIFDRLNVLNLEDSILELKTISSYFDNIYNDFDKERLSRTNFIDLGKNINTKIKEMLRIMENLESRINDIRKDYKITDEDVRNINVLGITLRGVREDYEMIVESEYKHEFPYSHLYKDMAKLNMKLSKVEESLDEILRLVSGYKEDEQRAKEQLDEIKKILASSKEKINSYKLPVVPKRYYTELSEAIEAINNMVHELEKKPLNIDVLNTRVDTARDLTLKLYKTTTDTVNTAKMSERAIIYGNRYRSTNPRVDSGLSHAEKLFYQGNFKESLEDALNAINIVEPGIHERLLSVFKD